MLPYQRPSVLNSPPKLLNNSLQQSTQYTNQHSASLAPLLSTTNNNSTSSTNNNNNNYNYNNSSVVPRPPLASTSSSAEWETKSQPNPSGSNNNSNGTNIMTPLGIKKPKVDSTITSHSDNGAQPSTVKTRVKRSKLACYAWYVYST